MQRIIIVGSGGAGKSTFARRLGDILGIPVTHLDTIFWKPQWQAISRDELIAAQQHIINTPTWIIDGNYSSTLDQRIQAADTFIFLDMPRWLCLYRILRRRIQYHGRSRPDITPGCPEQLTWEFIRFVWHYPRTRRPAIYQRMQTATHLRTLVLQSPQAVDRFLAQLASQHHTDTDHKMRYNAQGSIFEEKTHMSRTVVSTDQAAPAIGPYSQAIMTDTMVYCSGQIPLTPAGEFVDGDVTAQTEQVFANIQGVLAAAGSSLDKVVKVTVFLQDMNDFAAMNAVYGKYFTSNPPARSTVQVARLPRDAKVEIEVTALR